MELTITPLASNHQRKNFQCGEPSLDQYIRQYANQDIKRRVNRVFVASPIDQQTRIAGYYSLSAGSLNTAVLPDDNIKKLPKYPVPVALLGRLAIDQDYQGKGLGTSLVADALKRVQQVSQVLAVYAVVVDALSEHASDFYRQFGFITLPNHPFKLFLPLETVGGLVE